jgi:hypothetical protein
MAGNGHGITLTGLDTVNKNLRVLVGKWEEKAGTAMEIVAANLEQYGKQHRPWTDRTGNARASITGSSAEIDNGYETALAIGVNYGKYLETSFGGKYAIVWPTMNANRKKMLETIKAVLGG